MLSPTQQGETVELKDLKDLQATSVRQVNDVLVVSFAAETSFKAGELAEIMGRLQEHLLQAGFSGRDEVWCQMNVREKTWEICVVNKLPGRGDRKQCLCDALGISA